MNEFFESYPYVKWILIGFGVLALLSKYLNFDPLDNLINRFTKYKFKEDNSLGLEEFKELNRLMNEGNRLGVQKRIDSLKGSYRTFAFRSLAQYANETDINSWLNSETRSDLPKVIKAYKLVFDAWEIRGRDTVDTVSEKNLANFKYKLVEAKELLKSTNEDSKYRLNINALLLKIYKALNVERDLIQDTYQNAVQEDENHAELNFSYFSAISPKWGGSIDEVNAFLDQLPQKSEFINHLITAQYYFDYVHMMDGKDDSKRMKAFIEKMKSQPIDKDELYKYELYVLLYWLANNLSYSDLENYYKQLALPYWKD